jgi:hypothetical protein
MDCLDEFRCLRRDLPCCLRPSLMELATRNLVACVFMVEGDQRGDRHP